jgi:hypothetical protein
MKGVKVAKAIFTDCYSRRETIGQGVASHLCSSCCSVIQEEILPVEYSLVFVAFYSSSPRIGLPVSVLAKTLLCYESVLYFVVTNLRQFFQQVFCHDSLQLQSNISERM